MICVGETTVTFVAAIADGPAPCPCPISTVSPDTNPVPVIVIDVPPDDGPEPGLTPDTTGGTTAWIRPIESFPKLVNHIAPSGPAAIPSGELMPVPVKLVTVPPVVIRPIELFSKSALVNHSAPSGPAAIAIGSLMPSSVTLVTVPPVVIRPIELFPKLVNHSAPSGPAAIPSGNADAGAGEVGDRAAGRDPPDRAHSRRW